MAIKITKMESNNINDDYILTPLYGRIKITDSLDFNNYTHFDTIDNYDLFVNSNCDTLAVKSESVENIKETDIVYKTIEKLKNKYPELSKIEYVNSDNGDNAIIIKTSEENNKILDSIKDEYATSKNFKPNKITSNVLFLEVKESDITLEEDKDVTDLLGDQDMKNIINKVGVKLSGSESREQLKGIIKGALASNTQNK